MLRNPQVNRLIDDLADELNKQFRYITTHPTESQAAYEAALKDATIGVVTALHKSVVDFNVDVFYQKAGYPGTNPVHSARR